MQTRQFKPSYDETRIECRDCGYVITDQEKSDCGPDGKYYCVFCIQPLGLKSDISFLQRVRWTFFNRLDLEIHALKKRIRDSIYYDQKCLELIIKRNVLIRDQCAKLMEYCEPKNEFQLEHDRLTEEIQDIRREAVIIYYDALAHFGSHDSDHPPCTRNLTTRQKKILRNILKRYSCLK